MMDRWTVGYRCLVTDDCFEQPVRSRLRSMYAAARAKHKLRESSIGSTDIAVHMRRGDVNAVSNVQGRYCKLRIFEQAVRDVLRRADGIADGGAAKYQKVHVYSEASTAEVLAEIKSFDGSGLDVEFHLNDTAESSFPDLVSAGAVISLKSAFGLAAAVLSRGEVVVTARAQWWSDVWCIHQRTFPRDGPGHRCVRVPGQLGC